MVGIVGFLQGHRARSPPVIRQTPPSAESLGELSAARQALEGANVAPGTMATLR